MTKVKKMTLHFFSPYTVLNKGITFYKWKLDFVKHKNKEWKCILMVKENQNFYAKIYKYKKAWFYCCEIYIYILSITNMYIIFP